MSTPFLPSLLIFGLICVALVVAGEHKRIYYERTLDRYTSESRKQIMNKNIMIGNCVERESDTGMIRLCLNLNNTFALSTHDVWVVQNEDKRILSPSFSGNA